MKRGSTLFLRLALVGLVSLATFLSAVVLWSIFDNWNPEFPELTWLRFPVLFGLCLAIAALFVAAYQAWQLLNYVDSDEPFSKKSIRALRNIKFAAFVVGGVFLVATPLIFWIAEQDDAPGLIIFGFVFAGVPLMVGVFAGVLQQLIHRALELKSENDLTV